MIPRRLWRLSSEQYANATRDLLSLDTTPTIDSSVADGSSRYAFINGPDLTVQAAYLAGGLYRTAGSIVTQVAPRVPDLTGCGGGETGTACATRFARTFGRKAFRRPLDDAEVANLMKVYESVCRTTSSGCVAPADFNAAIQLMVKALILAPSFLYRTELGPSDLPSDASGRFFDTTLTPYEVATQLGFMFLDSMPDAALTSAADNGSLATTAGIMTEVTRLLALPAVRAHLTNVVTNWFEMSRLSAPSDKDPSLLSALAASAQDQPAIVADLMSSQQRFVSDVLWTGAGKVTDLLTSPRVFVNGRLATLYGLGFAGATPDAFVAATWPVTEPRAGILTQPGFLWATSGSSATSIVHRGASLQSDVVCGPQVAPSVELTSPAALAIINMGDSEGTRSDARLANLPCSTCHVQLDSYGRVLQGFDPVGRYRTLDEVGRAVAASTTFTVPPLSPEMVSGPPALADALVATGRFSGCAIQRLSGYAIGASIADYNTCQLNDLRTQLEHSDGTVSTLLSQVALADFVRSRAGGIR